MKPINLLVPALVVTLLTSGCSTSSAAGGTDPMAEFSRAEWLAFANTQAEVACPRSVPEGFAAKNVQVHALSGQHSIVQVLCNIQPLSNSYLFFNHYTHEDKTEEAALLAFATQVDGQEKALSHILHNASFNTSIRTIATHSIVDPSGNCGTAALYHWQEHFTLLEVRTKPECDGQFVIWPVVFSREQFIAVKETGEQEAT